MQSERLTFREVQDDDVPLLASWTRDPEVIKYMENVKPSTDEEEREWVEAMRKQKDERIFAVELSDDGRLIGTCGIHFRAPDDVELGIFLGDKTAWGKGYGPEVMRTLAQHAHANGATRVFLRVDVEHARAIRAYMKAGFRMVETRSCLKRYGSGQEHVMEWAPSPDTGATPGRSGAGRA